MKIYTYSQLKKFKYVKNSGFVYCIDYHNGLVKIGCTTKPYKRYTMLSNNAANYGNYPLGKIWLSERCSNYRQLEKYLHKTFVNRRVPNTELFKLNFGEFGKYISSLGISYDKDFSTSYTTTENTDIALGVSVIIALEKYHNKPHKISEEVQRIYNKIK